LFALVFQLETFLVQFPSCNAFCAQLILAFFPDLRTFITLTLEEKLRALVHIPAPKMRLLHQLLTLKQQNIAVSVPASATPSATPSAAKVVSGNRQPPAAVIASIPFGNTGKRPLDLVATILPQSKRIHHQNSDLR
jgi:hypothetical protein